MVPERFAVTPWNIDPAWRYGMVIDQLRDLWRDDLEIAEIGSGAAGITEFLDHPVTGVDPAFERTGDKANPRLTRVEGTATELPFADASFDVVLSLEMMEHLPAEAREPALREMLRVIRPGGRLVVTFPAGATAARLDAWLNAAYRRRHGKDHPWAVEHLANGLPEAEDIARLAASTGARRVRLRRHAWAPAWQLQQLLFSVEWGYPWTRAVGIHTTPTAGLLFRALRHLNRGDCYRAVLLVDA
ncbi:MAG TPA: methyltransferase domain-containing protein [Capillimicrobium sp.]